MNKSILLSVKPKYVAEILNHRKTIEIRKTAPKCDLPIEVYVYCTKGDKKLVYHRYKGHGEYLVKNKTLGYEYNGKAVAKFTLREVETITMRKICGEWEVYGERTDSAGLLRESCLTQRELSHYIGGKYRAYAWRISDLVIFDEPKNLSEFKKIGYKDRLARELAVQPDLGGLISDTVGAWYAIDRAPQSWRYVEASLI